MTKTFEELLGEYRLSIIYYERGMESVDVLAHQDAVVAEYNRIQAEVYRLTVQLAGCSVAASGYAEKPPLDPSAYGWSVAYQDVANLYERYENLLEENARLQAAFIFESAFNAPEPPEAE